MSWQEIPARDEANTSWTLLPDGKVITGDMMNATRSDARLQKYCPKQSHEVTGLNGPIFIAECKQGSVPELQANIYSADEFQFHLGIHWGNAQSTIDFTVIWEDGFRFGGRKQLTQANLTDPCSVTVPSSFLRQGLFYPGGTDGPDQWFDIAPDKKIEYVIIYAGFDGDVLFTFNRTGAGSSTVTPPGSELTSPPTSSAGGISGSVPAGSTLNPGNPPSDTQTVSTAAAPTIATKAESASTPAVPVGLGVVGGVVLTAAACLLLLCLVRRRRTRAGQLLPSNSTRTTEPPTPSPGSSMMVQVPSSRAATSALPLASTSAIATASASNVATVATVSDAIELHATNATTYTLGGGELTTERAEKLRVVFGTSPQAKALLARQSSSDERIRNDSARGTYEASLFLRSESDAPSSAGLPADLETEPDVESESGLPQHSSPLHSADDSEARGSPLTSSPLPPPRQKGRALTQPAAAPSLASPRIADSKSRTVSSAPEPDFPSDTSAPPQPITPTDPFMAPEDEEEGIREFQQGAASAELFRAMQRAGFSPETLVQSLNRVAPGIGEGADSAPAPRLGQRRSADGSVAPPGYDGDHS